MLFSSPLKMKPGASLLGLSFGSWSSGVFSPSLPLSTSPSPMPGHSLESTTAASVSSKSESPVPRIEKPSSMPSPALELPKSPDHPSPRPIPEGQPKTVINTISKLSLIEKSAPAGEDLTCLTNPR